MTLAQFRAKMLGYALGMGKALCESMSLEDTKIEQEQVRKNASTILVLLTETEDFLKAFDKNVCSALINSIAELVQKCKTFLEKNSGR